MPPAIFLIAGEAHVGKDTAADMLVAMFEARGLRAIKLGLADRLKRVCQRLIAMFYGIELPMADFYDEVKKEEVRADLPPFMGRPFKLRTILQQVGTQIFRDHLCADVWCDVVNRQYMASGTYDVLVIADCRFQNEIDYFRRVAGLFCTTAIRIERPSRDAVAAENRAHESETGIAGLRVDFNIDNNGTLDELRAALAAILPKPASM